MHRNKRAYRSSRGGRRSSRGRGGGRGGGAAAIDGGEDGTQRLTVEERLTLCKEKVITIFIDKARVSIMIEPYIM